MGRTQLIVLSQPRGGNIADLEDAIRRCVEAAPIRFVDALLLTKYDNDAIEFAAVSDILSPDRAWRGVLARALFGNGVIEETTWTMPPPSGESDTLFNLKEVHLLEMSDRIPRNSSSLLVLVEHHWMDELDDDQIAPGHLVANGWISIGDLIELSTSEPRRWAS